MSQQEAAQRALNRAVAKGVVVRPSECSGCGRTGKIQGHHPDYSRPLDVEWLCGKCHYRRHNSIRPGAGRAEKPLPVESPYRLAPGFRYGRPCQAGGHFVVYDRARGYSLPGEHRYLVTHYPSGISAPATSYTRAVKGIAHALFDPSRLPSLEWMVGRQFTDANGKPVIFGLPALAAESEAA